MLSFECIKNEKSVYFLLTSAAIARMGIAKYLFFIIRSIFSPVCIFEGTAAV